jgi:hypothetical protein
VSNKSIRLIQNPLIIGHVTRIHDKLVSGVGCGLDQSARAIGLEIASCSYITHYGDATAAGQLGKGTGLRRWWVLEEVGCHLQEGVPPCKSGMAEGNPRQE